MAKVRKVRNIVKRSNVPGKIPTELLLGELALNTADVKLYASGTTDNEVKPIGWDRINRTGDTVEGDLFITGDTTSGTLSAQTISINGGDFMDRIPSYDEYILFGANSSTGLLSGGTLSINASDNTKFDVSSGTGFISDNTTDPLNPTGQRVDWSGFSGQTLTNLTSDVATAIVINITSGISQYPLNALPSGSDKRDNILLGVIAHSNMTNITNIYNKPIPLQSPLNQLEDLIDSIGPFNKEGNFVSGKSGTLELIKSSGKSFIYGGNFINDRKNPSIINEVATSGSTTPQYPLVYAKSDMIIGISGYSIDTTNYDPNGNGTLTTLSNNKFTAHRLWYLPINNLIVFQYGQTEYGNLTEASSEFSNENFIIPPGLGSGAYLLSILITKEGETDLSSNNTRFIQQAPFAGSGGNGGSLPDTLQSSYLNSTDGKIITDITRGSLKLEIGDGQNSDNLIEFIDSGSTTNGFVTGEGNASFNELSGNTIYGDGQNLDNVVTSATTVGFGETLLDNTNIKEPKFKTLTSTGGTINITSDSNEVNIDAVINVGEPSRFIGSNTSSVGSILGTPIQIPFDNITTNQPTIFTYSSDTLTINTAGDYGIDISVNLKNSGSNSRSQFEIFYTINNVEPIRARSTIYGRQNNFGGEATIVNIENLSVNDEIRVFIVRVVGNGSGLIGANDLRVRLLKSDNLLVDSVDWSNITNKPDLSLSPGDLIGNWDALNNTPTLTSSSYTGAAGDFYIVSVSGNTNIDGNNVWAVNDWIVWSESQNIWLKIDNQSGVSSFNGQTGVVTVNSDDISQGTTNLYMSNTEKNKLATVQANAEQNVQVDLSETGSTEDSFVLNKEAQYIEFNTGYTNSQLTGDTVQAAIEEIDRRTVVYQASGAIVQFPRVLAQSFTVPGGGNYVLNYPNVNFSSILSIQATGQLNGATTQTAPIVTIGSYNTTSANIIVNESNTFPVPLTGITGGSIIEGLELCTNDAIEVHMLIVGTV